MTDSDIEVIGSTLARLATPLTTPKDLLKAVRKQHPDASARSIVRAAFYSTITFADRDPAKAKLLHDFALGERACGDLD